MCEKYVCLSVWESVQASASYLIIHVQCVYEDQIPAIYVLYVFAYHF